MLRLQVVGGIMQFIENGLGKSKFIVGDTLTIADFAAYCEVGQCQQHVCDLWNFDDYPNIRRWMKEMESVPGHKEAHAGLMKFVPTILKMKKAFYAKL
jgi:glutathione S-transferase